MSDHVPSSHARVEAALEQLRAGRGVVVFDDDNRENEGDLIYAAQHMTAEDMTFLIRNTSGLVCVGMEGERLDALHLPLMVEAANDPRGTAFTVSVDLAGETTTGISAADRTATVRALADPAATGDRFNRPGHIFPLRARPGGVLQRAGHTEAAVDLCRLAGLEPAGVLAELTNADGTMSRMPDLVRFAAEHDLPLLSVADLVAYRMDGESLVVPTAAAMLPTAYGDFSACTFVSEIDGREHVALVCGDPAGRADVLVRVHSECITGDVFAARRCDCGEQLQQALRQVAEEGCGVVLYLRGHEGRGIGLTHKLRAYQLQDDEGLDTVDANLALGLPVDSREYGVGAQILRSLGVSSIRLMTNNPAKYSGLAGFGLTISGRVPLEVTPNPHNVSYLRTKASRLQHQLGVAADSTAVALPIDEALTVLAGGVVTMTAADGEQRGFGADSFVPLSIDPPLVMAYLVGSADDHRPFFDTAEWTIDVAVGETTSVALRCVAESRHDGGDHTILIARVREAIRTSESTYVIPRAPHQPTQERA